MTDHYKITLEILAKILHEENYDHWAKWMQEDINLWEISKSIEHHLRAYGGMGSFNDVVIGSNNYEGIWRGHAFGQLQSFVYGLAKEKSVKSILYSRWITFMPYSSDFLIIPPPQMKRLIP